MIFFFPFLFFFVVVRSFQLCLLPTRSATTFPQTNKGPENQWLEHENPFGKSYFQGRAVSLGFFVWIKSELTGLLLIDNDHHSQILPPSVVGSCHRSGVN